MSLLKKIAIVSLDVVINFVALGIVLILMMLLARGMSWLSGWSFEYSLLILVAVHSVGVSRDVGKIRTDVATIFSIVHQLRILARARLG